MVDNTIVIPAKAGIQIIDESGSRVKPGMTSWTVVLGVQSVNEIGVGLFSIQGF